MAEQRRTPLWAKALIATVVIVTVAFYVGGGLGFSNMIHADALTPEPPTPDNVVWVREIEGNEIVITSEEERDDTTRDGLYGLAWRGGYGQIGEVLSTEGLEVRRAFYLLDGSPPPVCAGDLDPCEQVISKAGPIQTTRLRPARVQGGLIRQPRRFDGRLAGRRR